jgi:hypothetical protein
VPGKSKQQDLIHDKQRQQPDQTGHGVEVGVWIPVRVMEMVDRAIDFDARIAEHVKAHDPDADLRFRALSHAAVPPFGSVPYFS